jgi:RNA 2',3'-cyclic 3'-phosphodiesterase
VKKRIFIAIDISDEARRRVADYIGNLRREFPHLRIGWEREEKLHLTLKFLGESNEKQLTELVEIVGKIAAQFSGFELQIAETGIFPLLRKPRILWLGAKDETNSLSKISELLEIKCASIGFTRETRKFKPHLTLARLREPDKSKEIARKHVENEFEPARFEASGIVIYESKLLSSGSVYETIFTAKF